MINKLLLTAQKSTENERLFCCIIPYIVYIYILYLYIYFSIILRLICLRRPSLISLIFWYSAHQCVLGMIGHLGKMEELLCRFYMTRSTHRCHSSVFFRKISWGKSFNWFLSKNLPTNNITISVYDARKEKQNKVCCQVPFRIQDKTSTETKRNKNIEKIFMFLICLFGSWFN